METNIAETTDREIQDIIIELEKIGYEQVDQGYVEIDSPFQIKPEGYFEGDERNRIGLAIFPELLSYHDGKDWVTIPWICVKSEIEGEFATNDSKQKELVKWLVDSFKSAGYMPFKDEDSFAGYSTREQRKGYVIIKIYVNPSFPKGFWSNHAL